MDQEASGKNQTVATSCDTGRMESRRVSRLLHLRRQIMRTQILNRSVNVRTYYNPSKFISFEKVGG